MLVDRTKGIYKCRGCLELGKALGVGTVLDGELVYNRSFKDKIFMVFDVLAWDRSNEGKCVSYVQTTFKQRQDVFVNEILTKYAKVR